MKYPNKDYIEHLRRKYPPGTRLQLSCMPNSRNYETVAMRRSIKI